MADKNIRIRNKNGSEWDTLYPVTLDSNVLDNSGTPLNEVISNIELTPGPKGDPGPEGLPGQLEDGVIGTENFFSLTNMVAFQNNLPSYNLSTGRITLTNQEWFFGSGELLTPGEYLIRADNISLPNADVPNTILPRITTTDGKSVTTGKRISSGEPSKITITDEMAATDNDLILRFYFGNRTTGPVYGYVDKLIVTKGDGTVVWHLSEYDKKSTAVYSVPSEYPDLQSAFDRALISEPSNRPVDIMMENGYSPEKGIIMSNVNAGNITIKSKDAEVTVASTFTGDFISGSYSTLPVLDVLVDMNDKGSNGVTCEKGSSGRVNYWKGIKNAGGRGLYLSENSKMYARAAVVTGCNDRNVWVTRTSTFEGETGDFSANKGGGNAVYISRASTANLLEANISNAFKNGLAVVRSFVNAESVDVSGAASTGIIIQRGAYVISEFANAKNCGDNGVRVEHGAKLSGRGIDASGCTADCILVTHGSEASLYGSKANGGSSHGLRVSHASKVYASAGDFSDHLGDDIRATEGSEVHIYGSLSVLNLSRCTPNVANDFTGSNGVIRTDLT